MIKQVVVGSVSKANKNTYQDAGELDVKLVSYGKTKNITATKRDLIKSKKRLVNYAVNKKVSIFTDDQATPECPPSKELVKVVKPLICPCPKEGCCKEE